MQHIENGEYSAKQLMQMVQKEAQLAVDYIDAVLLDYDHTFHSCEHFSDVYMTANYVYTPNPKGDLRKATRGRHGVYVFVVNTDFVLSKQEVHDYCEKCQGAGINIRGERHLAKGQHFYQGSATGTSLHTRIKEHYSVHSQISALQLNNPNRIVVKDKLTLFIFPVVASLDYQSFFIRMIEEEIHNRHKAIAGSKRT